MIGQLDFTQALDWINFICKHLLICIQPKDEWQREQW